MLGYTVDEMVVLHRIIQVFFAESGFFSFHNPYPIVEYIPH